MQFDRQPQGAPDAAGGQFRTQEKTESNGTLELQDREYNTTGTFLFPPRPRSLAQFSSFWRDIPVDDGVLGNIANRYKWESEDNHKIWAEEFAGNYDRDHKDWDYRGRKGTLPIRNQEARERAISEEEARVRRIHPTEMHPLLARDVARACSAYRYAEFLPTPADADAARDETFQLGHETLTTTQIATRYLLDQIWPAFTDPEVSAIQSLSMLNGKARDLIHAPA